MKHGLVFASLEAIFSNTDPKQNKGGQWVISSFVEIQCGFHMG